MLITEEIRTAIALQCVNAVQDKAHIMRWDGPSDWTYANDDERGFMPELVVAVAKVLEKYNIEM